MPPPHRLRSIGSTGAPLPPDGFRWVRDVVGAEVQTASVSGGTDVCAAFVGAVPLLAGARGRDQLSRCSASRSRRSTPDGSRVPARRAGRARRSPSRCRRCRSGSGAIPTGEKLRAAYYDDYPGVWRHGDWITFTDDGACVISGRSDATLNRGGVRLGTSDFYAVVEGLPEVADSLVVHLEGDDPDETPWASCCCSSRSRPGAALDDDLAGGHRARSAHRAVAAARARRDRSRSRRCRARCRARSSRCR